MVLGCGPSTPQAGDAGADGAPLDAPCSPEGATIELGGGTGPTLAGYRPLSNGDTVYLTPGPQGGQHIWIGMRATGINPSQPLVTLRAYRGDGALIGQIRVRLRFSPLQENPSAYGLPALTLIIDDDRYCSVLAESVRITAELNDGAGHCLNVDRTVRVDGIDPAALEIDARARLACCTEFLRRCYPAGPPADASVPTDASSDAGDGE